jgi:NAD(P)-dependent dehydrogenase (short-subunit alcohol dehydrogenase family)
VEGLFSLREKVAIVTGAAGLLGREHCRALASAGAHVVLADLDVLACRRDARELPGSLPVEMDVTSPDSIRAARDEVMRRLGRIDVLVNNAAVDDKFETAESAAELSTFENYSVERWRRSMEVNVTGTFLCSQILGSPMAERGSGSIVNVASTYGVVAPDQSIYRKPDGSQAFFKCPAYPTSKGAVLQFTRFLAAYWGGRGVRVNALSPGGVQDQQEDHFIVAYSKRTPLGRMARPTDYRGALVFLASDASAYMTGANLIVDGGWTAW